MEANEINGLSGWDYISSYEFFDHVRSSLSDDQIDYAEWQSIVRKEREEHEGTDKEHNLGFVPSVSPWIPRGGTSVPNFDPSLPFREPFYEGLNNFSDLREATADKLVDAASTVVQTGLERAGQALKTYMGTKAGISVGGGDDGGTTKDDYSGGSNYNKHGLSLNAKPINSTFSTGIVPDYKPLFFNDGDDNDAPLILVYGNVFPELDSDGTGDFSANPSIQRFLNIDIVSEWAYEMFARMRLNSYTESLPTKEFIFNNLRVQMYGLSVYYFYTYVIAHINVKENRNSGMINLFEALSAEDLQELARLELLLNKTKIDPRINQFVFHLFNSYKQSHLPGSPLYKLIPVEFEDSTNKQLVKLKSGAVAHAIDALGSAKYKKFITGYVQAYPDVDSPLLMYTGMPNFDADHLTFIRNFPTIGYSSSVTSVSTHVPHVDGARDLLVYNCDTDAPDAWTQSSSGVWIGGTDQIGCKISGGFGAPKKLGSQNSDGFYETDLMVTNVVDVNASQTTVVVWNDEVFRPASSGRNLADVYSPSYMIYKGQSYVTAFQRSGCQVVTPVSIYDMQRSSEKFASFLFSPPRGAARSRNTQRPGRRPDKRKESKQVKEEEMSE